jgi:hypothetical protein
MEGNYLNWRMIKRTELQPEGELFLTGMLCVRFFTTLKFRGFF